MSKRQRPAENVPAERFVKVFVEMSKAGATADEIGAELGITGKSVHTRASQYRTKHNIKLPVLQGRGKGGGKSLDVDALNALCE